MCNKRCKKNPIRWLIFLCVHRVKLEQKRDDEWKQTKHLVFHFCIQHVHDVSESENFARALVDKRNELKFAEYEKLFVSRAYMVFALADDSGRKKNIQPIKRCGWQKISCILPLEVVFDSSSWRSCAYNYIYKTGTDCWVRKI